MYENDTYAVQNAFHEQLINSSIPPSDDPTKLYDECHVRSYSGRSDVYTGDSGNVTSYFEECSEWVYDTSVFQETFTSKVL